jgi:hypothetical protein
MAEKDHSLMMMPELNQLEKIPLLTAMTTTDGCKHCRPVIIMVITCRICAFCGLAESR